MPVAGTLKKAVMSLAAVWLTAMILSCLAARRRQTTRP